MFRDGVQLRTEDHVNFVIAHSALGDMITSLPAIQFARRTVTQDVRITVWLPEHQIPLVRTLLGPAEIKLMPLHEFKAKVGAGSADLAGPGVINATYKNTVTRNRLDMVEYAYLTLLDRLPETPKDRNYPTAPLGPRRINVPYVVFPVGATNDASVFHPGVMGPVIDYVLSRRLLPVILGKSETHVKVVGSDTKLVVRDLFDALPESIRQGCLDLRDQTTLLEARDICGHAEAVVGIDGGTLHLAGTTAVPIVYGCTRVDPRHRPITRADVKNWRLRHVAPRGLGCAGCQSNWALMFNHDFRFCGYGDFKCVTTLAPSDFIIAISHLTKGA